MRRDATHEEIRKAYFRLTKKHHPEVDQSADATSRFNEINRYCEANSVEHMKHCAAVKRKATPKLKAMEVMAKMKSLRR